MQLPDFVMTLYQHMLM